MGVRARMDRTGTSIGAGPARRAVATTETYSEAERLVDYLSDNNFPVNRVSIVGRGLSMVEQVTGRLTWWRAALQGASSGALAGVLIGWLFGLFDWFDPILSAFWLALNGLWFGALVGALMGVIFYAFTGGRRDFTSIAAMQADHYDVLVDDEVADEAARLLAGMPPASPSRPEAAAAPRADGARR